MKKSFTFWLFTSLLLFSGKSFAQCFVNISGESVVCTGDNPTLSAQVYGPGSYLATANFGGNNHRGNMFDIVATNSVTITSFDAFPMGNTTIEIYYKAGTWNGFANTPSAWTFVGSAPVTYTGGFSAVPVNVNVTIPAGETYAFYVTSAVTGGTALNYSNGTAVGNVFASDANITFLEGGGMEYPFTQGTGAVYQPRIWNGNIHYALANQPGTTFIWGGGETTASIQPTINTASQFTIQTTTPGCPTMYDTLSINTSVPPVSAGLNQTICFGDSLILFGTGAVSYSWDNGITDSVSFTPSITGTTTYTVTGTDTLGCQVSASVDVNVNELPNVFAGSDINSCIGDQITLSGQGAVNYSWFPPVADGLPFTPLTGEYILTGIDSNGCVNWDSVYVEVHNNPNVSAGPDQDICYGSETTLSGSGAVSYQWTNGITDNLGFIAPSGTTWFVVTGTDMYGCSDLDSVSITATAVQAPIQLIGETLGTAVNVNGTLQWYNCDTQLPILGEDEFLFNPTNTGNYAVMVIDTVNQCQNMSECVYVGFTNISESTTATFSVYPNPTSGIISISAVSATIQKIKVYDMVGKVIYEANPNLISTTLDLSQFEGEQFVISIYSDDRIETAKATKL